MGQFIKIAISDQIGIAKITYLPTSDYKDGVYNIGNRIDYIGVGAAAHTQQTPPQLTPSPPPSGVVLSDWSCQEGNLL